MLDNKHQKDFQLKAKICRAVFPELVSFLKNLDISDSSAQRRDYEDSLNMRFLLQACKYVRIKTKKQKEDLVNFKEECKWQLNDVKERDVLIAINEYFDITSDSHDLEKYRNVLLRNVIQSGKVEKYDFEDNTTLSIINHFSIHSDEKGDIGTQVQWFGQFIKEAYGIRAEEQEKNAKELCFQKAFKLLSYLRNMKNHNGGIFSEEELKIFHKYIFYTHIGIVYVCQRVWKEHSTILSNVKNKEGKCIYNIPKCLNRELDIEIIEVRIKADGKNNEISDCRYKVGDGNEYFVNEKPNNEIHFSIQAPKYAPISINFICQNEEYSDNRTINYYWWNPVLEITVKPPMTVSYTFKDITGKDDNITDSKIGELYAKFEESLERHSIAEKKVLSRLEKIEPIILQLQDFNLKDKLSAQENNQKKELKEKLTEMIEGLNSQFDTLGEEIKKAGESQKRIDKTINKHFEKQDKQIKDLLENVKGIQNDYYKKDRTQFLGKHFFLTLPLAILVCFIVFTNNYNFYYLDNKLLVFVVALGLLASLGGILWYIYNTTTRPSLLSPRFKAIGLTLSAVTLIAFVVAWIRMPIKTVDELIVKYDFGKEHAKGDNERAIQIVKDYLKENEENEEARLFLAKYYLNIANDKEKALEVTSPMRLDTKKYPKGSVYAAEALYESDPDNETIIMHVGEFIDMYRKEYGNQMDNVPAEINRLEGIINCYNNKELEKGVALLKYAADIQDDSKAQYHMGWITSHIMEQSGKGGVQDTLFNLITAIKYFKKALNKEPKAALELGTLYADLNMKDSAEYYFQKVISNSDKKLNIEAKYKMGLLLESKGDSTNKYLAEARAAEYTPALLHAAINKQNHKEAIRYYEVAGRYKGHRYIPPIVFEYIYQGNNGAALDTLCSTRAYGNFNEEFVDGVRAVIVENDSLRAMECWRQSAEKGCQYAKMICLFRDIEHDIKNNRFREESLNELKRISDEITFANVLIANLLLQQGRLFEKNKDKHLDNTEQSSFYYKMAEEFGKKAIAKGHPGGIFALDDARIYGYHFDSFFSISKKHGAKQERSYRYLLLRMAPEKRNHIYFGYAMDAAILKVEDNKWADKTHFDFWIDAAIANDDLTYIIGILMNLENVNIKDVEKITSSAINLIDSNTNPKMQELLSLHIGNLRNIRGEEFANYLFSLEKTYENDFFRKNIISSNNNLSGGEKVRVPYNSYAHLYNIDTNSLLQEFGNVAAHLFDKPI